MFLEALEKADIKKISANLFTGRGVMMKDVPGLIIGGGWGSRL
jgi:hypothetical protein